MDMFLKCLTFDCPNIKTLNYSPGPMDTDMGKDMMNINGSESMRKSFKEMFDLGTIIKPLDSARKLFQILNKNSFTSGDHIDYYDM